MTESDFTAPEGRQAITMDGRVATKKTPAGISAAELEATLAGVPESIEETAERFGAAETDESVAGGGGT
ncbi:hypothetical protein [Halorubrum sodomense]|uniref:Uncharacterized protein n=1 Tax=Halorubrum sodomense TaxID=35743 RepID=A0A1I6H035_HALSD|nr:hypothetical protein [Halorubrum sodomense]SFR47802.1 hypothetical protein SAMN04487937_2241 [Halorubrum sodomense]